MKHLLAAMSLLLILTGCSTKQDVGEQDSTRAYTDSRNEVVNIPLTPKRIVMQGNAIGDLLALGIEPVGVDRRFIDTGVLEMKAPVTAEDIGFPTSIEKVLELAPDLIMLSYLMENEDKEAAKIAPTVVFDGMAPVEERFSTIADIVGKKEAGDTILADYKKNVADMWAQQYKEGTFTEGQTATILQYFHNKSMYIAKTGGLANVVYAGLGMSDEVAALQPNSGPYISVSPELLHKNTAGDHLFVLVTNDPEAKAEFQAFRETALWQSLPAVKNGKVHFIEDKWNYDDMVSLQLLAEHFPTSISSTMP